jgi:hypothetical protein
METLSMPAELMYRVDQYFQYMWANRRAFSISQFVKDEVRVCFGALSDGLCNTVQFLFLACFLFDSFHH